MNYQAKLRAFATYLDNHPEVAEKIDDKWDYPSYYVWTEGWEAFQSIITHLDGFEKGGSGESLQARHKEYDEDEHIIFSVSVSVSGVCEAVPKVDDEGKPVMRAVTKYITTDETEVVMEYKCPEVWTR